MIERAASISRHGVGEVPEGQLPRILIVEDEPALADLFDYVFRRESFEVTRTGDGQEALVLARDSRPDVILLDWMIPSLSGMEVLKHLRRTSPTAKTPIIMVSARGEETDRIAGLASGADDYVSKPVSPRELVARVRAVLRRDRSPFKIELVTFGDLEMNLSQHKVRRGGKAISLGPKEFRLLRHFMENPKRVFMRETLVDLLWGGGAEIDRRTIDVLIRRLRQAINTGFDTQLIHTVRTKGYSLCGCE